MKPASAIVLHAVFLLGLAFVASAQSQFLQQTPLQPQAAPSERVPEPLKPWIDWVLRDVPHYERAPRPYNDADDFLPVWPTTAALDARQDGATFQTLVTVYSEEWTPLPGNERLWPQDVRVNDAPAPVIARNGIPHVRLAAGRHSVTGSLVWTRRPQNIQVPRNFGLLSLVVDGQPVSTPRWDESGLLWLQLAAAEPPTGREEMSVRIHRLLEDGIPMWLRTRVEITAAGKNREETIGHILPTGWMAATVESPIPCALDEAGVLKVQLRPGVWTVEIDAFRTTPMESVAYGSEVTPAVPTEVLGFKAAPELRLVELRGIDAIDVSQTSYPSEWRIHPVYRWETQKSFQLEERLRGMGSQRPPGLRVDRRLWLSPDGSRLTFLDRINGEAQQLWRLDLSPGQILGAVRIGNQPQLVTRNPANGHPGIELRTRELQLNATGFVESPTAIPASGWQTDVENASVNLQLPPGWRLFSVGGVGWSRGDWITAWSLLDIFLVLVFVIAVFKLFNPMAAVLALLALVATYHEPGAPRFIWLLLLIPLAMLRALPKGVLHGLARALSLILTAILVLTLVPFAASQIQAALYPQLEPLREPAPLFIPQDRNETGDVSGFAEPAAAVIEAAELEESDRPERSYSSGRASKTKQQVAVQQLRSNLMYAPEAKIQTGPALPEWQWRSVSFGWRGPVAPGETATLHLVPPPVQRGLSVARAVLAILLAALLCGLTRLLPRMLSRARVRSVGATSLLLTLHMACLPQRTDAQSFPDTVILEQLRQHLLEAPQAFPTAASIPSATLNVEEGTRRVRIETNVHAAEFVAVPLPGQLPTWSPVAVTINGAPAESLLRNDGWLWIALPTGQHTVVLEGLLPDAPRWECSFLLKPQRLEVNAPGWTIDGLDPDGVPGQTVFLARNVTTPSEDAIGTAAYDRSDFNPILRVERTLEFGIVWKARTTVTRLARSQKAVAAAIPLLPGERVLSGDFGEIPGIASVRLEPSQDAISWESELAQAETLTLTAAESSPWVELWRLNASPVWNVVLSGLAPIHEPGENALQPVWHPWPGENATLAVARPDAVTGPTLTVTGVTHAASAGARQIQTTLELRIEATVGQELPIAIEPDLEVSALRIQRPDGKFFSYPVRREANTVVVPVVPGAQTIILEGRKSGAQNWRTTPPAFSLPIESSNISTELRLPSDRWLIWTAGPQRGPAVRLWTVLVCVLAAAVVLSRLKNSPLHGAEWALLGLGLIQVDAIAALVVASWFFLLAWRGSEAFPKLHPALFNLFQLFLAALAIPVFGILVAALNRGFLGDPQMFVAGNGSTASVLRWFAPHTESALPQPAAFTVSIWFYRGLMLVWALWLAFAAIRWVRWAWERWNRNGAFQPLFTKPKPAVSPPTPSPR